MNNGGYPAYILAGGLSSRLGSDKSMAPLSPEITLIEAVIQSLDGAFSSFTAVAEEGEKFSHLGLRTIVDEETHLGPMGGILRAAVDAEEGYFFVVSCDRVGLRKEWVDLLIPALAEDPPAVAFRHQGRWEPLFGFYHTRLAPLLGERLRTGQGSLWRFLDDSDARFVAAPPDWHRSFSVNTPPDLQRARQLFADR